LRKPGAPSVNTASATGTMPCATIAACRTDGADSDAAARDRIDHQRFERALAKLAEQKTREKVALRVGRAREQRSEDRRALSLSSRRR
jgi:hypothetical protein